MHDIRLFSYGTLQQDDVQMATFGRRLEGHADVLPGYSLKPVAISDPYVVAVSGLAVHAIAYPTGNTADTVPGVVFTITADELAAADTHEVDYGRREVVLASGTVAFAYLSD